MRIHSLKLAAVVLWQSSRACWGVPLEVDGAVRQRDMEMDRYNLSIIITLIVAYL